MKKEYIGESGYILYMLTAIIDLLASMYEWGFISSFVYEILYIISLILIVYDVYLGWKNKKHFRERLVMLIIFIALFLYF
tara:strand:+ start:16 stop:255 length:240 start_codon:yes stop_codon:yes gene_type:complete